MNVRTANIPQSNALYVLVADTMPDRLDYRGLVPDAKVQWGFVSRPDIFAAALRLQTWDMVIVDQSLLSAIPTELIVTSDVTNQTQQLILLLDPEHLEQALAEELLNSCGYLLRGPTVPPALTRLIERQLNIQSLSQERTHLEQEITRILGDWEQSIRERTRDLERTNEKLKTIDEMKSQFLANISHELRTPLTVVRSYLDLLLECPPQSDDERNEFLAIILAESVRLSRLIDDLIELARMDADRVDWDIKSISLPEILTRVISDLSGPLEHRQITIDNTTPSNLPLLQVDADRIVQVFTNLLDNAIRFSPKQSSIRLSAELASGDDDEAIHVVIEDSGQPIADEDLDVVFDRLDADKNASRKDRGTGLSLTVCREIVERHNGRIWATASELGGVAFQLIIPLADHLDVLSEVISVPRELLDANDTQEG